MYVDIDWHSIGNLETEVFQDPMYQTSRAETFNFWRTIANHLQGNNTVVFYELFNEPSNHSDQWGPVSWDEWKKLNEDLVTMIHSYDRNKIAIIAGFDWAYGLTPLRKSPLNAEGIAYSVHPYVFKRSKPWQPKWDEDFGFAAEHFPVVATEFGFWTPKNPNPATEGYQQAIVKYLESRGFHSDRIRQVLHRRDARKGGVGKLALGVDKPTSTPGFCQMFSKYWRAC